MPSRHVSMSPADVFVLKLLKIWIEPLDKDVRYACESVRVLQRYVQQYSQTERGNSRLWTLKKLS